MAKAKKVPADFQVELTLTREEAEALRAVCSRIGGPPASRRRHFDAIAKELYPLGISENDSDISTRDQAIYFTDGTK